MPFLFVSGYDKGHLNLPDIDPACTAVLSKPYDTEKVSRLLSEMLSADWIKQTSLFEYGDCVGCRRIAFEMHPR